MSDFNLNFFFGTVFLIHILYLAVFLGLLAINEKYIRNFSTLVQLGVCLFLIYRFFPYYKSYSLTKLDVSVIFYCSTFLLLNVVITEIYTSFIQGTMVGNLIDTYNTTINQTIMTNVKKYMY